MKKETPLLSACMIVKNESQYLAQCLRSLHGVVDELIIVDTGSTDNTVEIARRFGAKIHHFQWQNDFAKARNYALAQASGRWILSLDADEELPSSTQKIIRQKLQSTDANGFLLTVRNLLPDGELTKYSDAKIIRLFENNACHRFQGRIHEQVGQSISRSGGTIQSDDMVIVHHGYRQKQAQGQARAGRNLSLLLTMCEEDPSDAYIHYQLGLTYRSMNDNAKAEAALSKAILNNQGHLSAGSLERAYISLSQLALARGDNREAMARARAGLRLNGKNTIGLYVLGLCAFTSGDFQTAQITFDRLLRNDDVNHAQTNDLKLLLNVCKQSAQKTTRTPVFATL